MIEKILKIDFHEHFSVVYTMKLLRNMFFMKWSERNISQCILALRTPFLQNTSGRLLLSFGRLYEVRTSYIRQLDVQRTFDAHWVTSSNQQHLNKHKYMVKRICDLLQLFIFLFQPFLVVNQINNFQCSASRSPLM